MKTFWRWTKRVAGALVVLVLLLLAPVLYIEAACGGEGAPEGYRSVLPVEHHRAEVKTLLTYPEWHIVHAYDDYAKVIATGDPHHFGYLRAIGGFWSSLCALTGRSASLTGDTAEIERTVYVIGVSFTAELLAKALYEETVGRVATWVRGAPRAPLDDLSSTQAADYARFLQQVPWYEWDFEGDVAALEAARTDAFRDSERRFALGIEFGGKAAYADVIAAAVASTGADALTLRMVVRAPAEALEGLDDVTVVEEIDAGTVIETPRYRALTVLLADMAARGIDFVEIAGNDDILLTVTSPDARMPDALFTFARQGHDDYRHLFLTKVMDLADRLRGFADGSVALEHVHDY